MLSYFSIKFGSKSTSDNGSHSPQSITDQDNQSDHSQTDRSCLGDTDDNNKAMDNHQGNDIQDEDQGGIIFCKNNVRARLPYCGEVVNGYIVLRSCYQERHLIFRWLPNQLMLDTPLHQQRVDDDDAKPIFKVDTRHIKAIKIFVDDDTFYSGRLVLKSLLNQYKVFHFQHGGLDRLCKVFDSWHSCVTLLSSSPELNTRHYDICTPNGDSIKLRLPYRQKIDRQVWHSLFDSHGRLIKKTQFKEVCFNFASPHTCNITL